MSETDTNTETIPKTEAAAATAPDPSQTVEVGYDAKSKTFDLGPDNGNVSFTRYKGEGPEFSLFLKKKADQTWKFVYWDADPKPGAPKLTPSGDQVLSVKEMKDHEIEIVDLIEIPDKTTAKYKYSFAIELDNGTREPLDPEITNNREVTLNRP